MRCIKCLRFLKTFELQSDLIAYCKKRLMSLRLSNIPPDFLGRLASTAECDWIADFPKSIHTCYALTAKGVFERLLYTMLASHNEIVLPALSMECVAAVRSAATCVMCEEVITFEPTPTCTKCLATMHTNCGKQNAGGILCGKCALNEGQAISDEVCFHKKQRFVLFQTDLLTIRLSHLKTIGERRIPKPMPIQFQLLMIPPSRSRAITNCV